MKSQILNKSIAGRPLEISASGTNLHELRQQDEESVRLQIFNSASAAKWCKLTYNGKEVLVTVPAEHFVELGPFALRGRAADGTAVNNKNLFATAEEADAISILGVVE